MPPFTEVEVESYFGAFECIVMVLCWPKEVWPLFLQCHLTGKAQEVCSTLYLDDNLSC